MLKVLTVLAVLLIGIFLHQNHFVKEGKIVKTNSGPVKGIVSQSRNGREFWEWLGIPYAKPPVGNLRFASPQPVERWEEVLDGSQYGSLCAQWELGNYNWKMGEEDCLFLNIHVPNVGQPGRQADKVEEINGLGLLPVLIFIPGGGYVYQGSDLFHANYFMDENLVLVTLNYRLGVFGFLNTGDEIIRGNMGLKDQVLAMKWVKENIAFFGGDPEKVTISGESAGGANVHYHMLSSGTKGLFQRAISQSGVANSPWAFESTEVAKKRTQTFAEKLDCPTLKSSDLASCLLKKTTNELLNAYFRTATTVHWFYPYLDGDSSKPSLEAVNDSEAYVVENPLQMVEQGKAQRMPWMLGVCSHEGLFASASLYRDPERMKIYESKWTENTLRIFGLPDNLPNAAYTTNQIREFYFPAGVSLSTEQKLEQYTKLFGDALIYPHVSYAASVQREFSPNYIYHFSRRGGFSTAKLLGSVHDYTLPQIMVYVAKTAFNKWYYGISPSDIGVSHFDDTFYLFPKPSFLEYLPETRADYEFSRDFVKLWASFAQHKPLEFRKMEIPRLEPLTPMKYFDLNEIPAVIDEPFKNRLQFLRSLNVSNFK